MTSRFDFTKEKIEGIRTPSAGKRTVAYDARVPKLAVRVTASDARTFFVVKWRATGVAWERLGSYPDMTIEKARKAAERVLGQYADGIDPAQVKRAERAQMTLGDAFE